MLHSFLGDEDFRKGMSLYLNQHAYNNTQTEDLWAALGESSGKPVRSVSHYNVESTESLIMFFIMTERSWLLGRSRRAFPSSP